MRLDLVNWSVLLIGLLPALLLFVAVYWTILNTNRFKKLSLEEKLTKKKKVSRSLVFGFLLFLVPLFANIYVGQFDKPTPNLPVRAPIINGYTNLATIDPAQVHKTQTRYAAKNLNLLEIAIQQRDIATFKIENNPKHAVLIMDLTGPLNARKELDIFRQMKGVMKDNFGKTGVTAKTPNKVIPEITSEQESLKNILRDNDGQLSILETVNRTGDKKNTGTIKLTSIVNYLLLKHKVILLQLTAVGQNLESIAWLTSENPKWLAALRAANP